MGKISHQSKNTSKTSKLLKSHHNVLTYSYLLGEQDDVF
jgi:hypothetical protein